MSVRTAPFITGAVAVLCVFVAACSLAGTDDLSGGSISSDAGGDSAQDAGTADAHGGGLDAGPPPDPAIVGCRDGAREAFVDPQRYPEIAGCRGECKAQPGAFTAGANFAAACLGVASALSCDGLGEGTELAPRGVLCCKGP